MNITNTAVIYITNTNIGIIFFYKYKYMYIYNACPKLLLISVSHQIKNHYTNNSMTNTFNCSTSYNYLNEMLINLITAKLDLDLSSFQLATQMAIL